MLPPQTTTIAVRRISSTCRCRDLSGAPSAERKGGVVFAVFPACSTLTPTVAYSTAPVDGGLKELVATVAVGVWLEQFPAGVRSGTMVDRRHC